MCLLFPDRGYKISMKILHLVTFIAESRAMFYFVLQLLLIDWLKLMSDLSEKQAHSIFG